MERSDSISYKKNNASDLRNHFAFFANINSGYLFVYYLPNTDFIFAHDDLKIIRQSCLIYNSIPYNYI
jgi:hypothetical protein